MKPDTLRPKSMYESDRCACAQASAGWPKRACQGVVCVARVCLDQSFLEPLGEGRRDLLTVLDAPLSEQFNLGSAPLFASHGDPVPLTLPSHLFAVPTCS